MIEEQTELEKLLASTDEPQPEPLPTDPQDAPPAAEADDPPVPAPTPAPEDDRFAALEARLAASEERERKYLEMLERSQQSKDTTPVEPDIDPLALIDQHFEGATGDALRKVVAALESRYSKRFATRDDVAQYQTTTAQMAATQAEQQAQAALREKGVADADIKTVQDRIWTNFKRDGRARYNSAEEAYRAELGELLLERQYAKGDSAAAAKQRVNERAAKTATPSPAAPSAQMAPKLDVRALRKEKGRRLSVLEIAEAAEGA